MTITTRRLAGTIATFAAAGLALAVSTPALAVPSAPTSQTRATPGLFGAADPTYDGVFRQSLALVGLKAAAAPVPTAAVTWLAGQQCSSGAFQAYRADTAVPCAAPDPATFSGPDSNSTALGAIALGTSGRTAEAAKALAALLATQNADGGWGYTLGATSDVNSTGLVLTALKGSAGPKTVRTAVNKATGYIKAAQIACTATADSRFALPYQPGQTASPLASAQALWGIAGTLPVQPGTGPSARAATCKSALGQQVASYLDALVRTTGGKIPSALSPAQVDWNSTASAVIALAATGGAPSAVRTGLAALGANTAAYTGTGPTASPAALGTLIQAAVAGGQSPRRFGATSANLVVNLLATLQK